MPLSEDDKRRIEEEESYRASVRARTSARPSVSSLRQILRVVTAFITVVALIVGFAAGRPGDALMLALVPFALFCALFVNRAV